MRWIIVKNSDIYLPYYVVVLFVSMLLVVNFYVAFLFMHAVGAMASAVFASFSAWALTIGLLLLSKFKFQQAAIISVGAMLVALQSLATMEHVGLPVPLSAILIIVGIALSLPPFFSEMARTQPIFRWGRRRE